ncbi:terminase small subunit [Candidatus Marinimicrobia bacterium]|nr:terminase small subunit [Candidatus Neomarinimicrobiota bacterium]
MKNQQTNQSSSRALSFDKRLTLKQQRFVDAYIQSGGDGAQAVIAAGYKTKSRQSIHTIACENLKKPLIRLELERQGYKDCGLIQSDAIVEARKIDERDNRVSSRQERAAFLTSVFEDTSQIIGARLKAADMLNRMYGDYRAGVELSEREARLPSINIFYTDDKD